MPPPASFISAYFKKSNNSSVCSVCMFQVQKDGKYVECNTVVKQKGGTSNLHYHARKHHKNDYDLAKIKSDEANALL